MYLPPQVRTLGSTSPVVPARFELVMNVSSQLFYFREHGKYQFRDSSNNFQYIHWRDTRFRLSDRGREELVKKLNNEVTNTVSGRPIYLFVLKDQEGASSTEVFHLVYPPSPP